MCGFVHVHRLWEDLIEIAFWLIDFVSCISRKVSETNRTTNDIAFGNLNPMTKLLEVTNRITDNDPHFFQVIFLLL